MRKFLEQARPLPEGSPIFENSRAGKPPPGGLDNFEKISKTGSPPESSQIGARKIQIILEMYHPENFKKDSRAVESGKNFEKKTRLAERL